jgi:hypothetical protein
LQLFQKDVLRHGLEVDREHAYSAIAKEWKRPYPSVLFLTGGK